MKVNQIATILNNVFTEITDGTGIITEDLSNIVDVGREITKNSTFDENFENYVGKLIDHIGRVVYMDRAYTSQAPKILKDGWEYGSILEKVRCDVPDFQENKEWELTEETVFDVFGFNPADADAKFFNKKTTFQIKISITKKQLKSAFNSASDMNKFIAMIENRIAMKMTLATDALIMRTIVNLIAEKISDKTGVINLLDVYKTATGDSTLTAAKALTNKDFLRIASKTIMTYKKLMTIPSALYNDGTYVTFTPEANLKAVFAADFDLALKTSLYADTYNDEFVKLDGYSSVAFWQSPKSNERLLINAKPASKGGAGAAVEQDGIIAVLFDERAAAVCNEEPDVRSIYNPEGNFYNYWYSFDASYMNDTVENCVVFIIEDPSVDPSGGQG